MNAPYSSSEPNKSGIVNRQSGGEKLKYILKFYIGDTCHVISRMRNDNLALCLWAHDVCGTISRNPLEIETWVQWTTNRKWPIGMRMVTWMMTLRDPERSRSWPNIFGALYLDDGWRYGLDCVTFWLLGIKWSRERWRRVTLNGQDRDIAWPWRSRLVSICDQVSTAT